MTKDEMKNRITVKESVKNEIKRIHEEYDKEGGKICKTFFAWRTRGDLLEVSE